MSRAMILTAMAAAAAAVTLPVLPANAQIDVYIAPSPPVYVAPPPMYVAQVPSYTYNPPRGGAWGARDRDGVDAPCDPCVESESQSDLGAIAGTEPCVEDEELPQPLHAGGPDPVK